MKLARTFGRDSLVLRLSRFILIHAASLALLGYSARAATVVWNPDNPELEPVWSTPRNWDGGMAPSLGDSLVFGAGGSMLNENNFPVDSPFSSITFTNDNWDLTGNAIQLTAAGNAVLWNPGTLPSNDNILEMPITFTTAATISTLASANALIFTGAIANGGHLLQISAVAGGTVILGGQVTGAGGLKKIGAGRLVLGGAANDYAGDTTVTSGTLEVAFPNAIPGGSGAGDLVLTGTLDLKGSSGKGSLQLINGLSGTGVITNSSPLVAELVLCGNNVAKTFTFDGYIQGELNLSKVSSQPVLVLTRPNTYTGSTTAHAGTVRLGIDNALPLTTTLIIGTATDDAVFDLAVFSQQVAGLRRDTTGIGLITNSGSGSVTLTFSNTIRASEFTGRILDRPLAKVNVTVAGGKLALRQELNNFRGFMLVTNSGSELVVWTRSAAAGPVSVGNGATFGVTVGGTNETLNTASLTLGAGSGDQASLTVDLGAFGNPKTAPITVGSLTANGVVSVNISSSKPHFGQFPLVKYSGAIGGTGFGAFALGSLPPGVTAQLVNNTSGSSVDLKITDYVGSLVWTGNASGGAATAWDIGLTKDWSDVVSGVAAAYTETKGIGPLVLFDDSASNGVVNVTTTVKPFSVTTRLKHDLS
jgi:autotransporter-associated beta strand protein